MDRNFTGADIDWDDGPYPHVTEDGRCSECAYELPLDDLKLLDFGVEDSGVSDGYHYGPSVHWATGTIGCPNCKERLPYEVSS